jgi:hypothetical protein
MKILKNIFGKQKIEKQVPTDKVVSRSNMPNKLTKAKEREFFKLIIDEETNQAETIQLYLKEFPSLCNSVVSGMKKGIDGFSSLMLAIRFYDFNTARMLIKLGANVNFIDSSNVRENHSPVFFDLLQMTRDFIEWEEFQQVEVGFKLWDLMESKGLDYRQKSIVNDGINRSKNCLEAFLSFASIKYGNQHLLEPKTGIIKKGIGNPDKEFFYERIVKRLIESVSDIEIKELDANHYRSISGIKRPIYIEHGYVDPFILDVTNNLVFEKFGFEIKNIKDESHIRKLDKEITRFANIV